MTVGALLNTAGSTQYLPFSGGTLTGPLHMGTNLIDGSNFLVSGGSITDAAVSATTLSASGTASFTGAGTGLSVTNNATVGGTFTVTGAASAGSFTTTGTGTLTAGNNISVNNLIRLTPTSSGGMPTLGTLGVDSNIGLNITLQGTGVLTVNPVTTHKSAVNINPGLQTYSGSSITQPVLNVTSSVSSTTSLSGNSNINFINCSADSGAVSGANNFLQCLNIGYGFGGATMVGNRLGLNVVTTFGATSGNKNAGVNPFYQTVNFTTNINATDGGTGTTLATGWGQVFAGAAVMAGNTSATNFLEASIWEDDMFFTGTTARRIGHKVVDISGASGSQGTVADQAYRVALNGSSPGWREAYSIGGDISPWPVTGWLFRAGIGTSYAISANSIQYGFDILGTACTSECWRSNGTALLDAGAARFNTLYVVNDTSGPTLDAKGQVGAYSSVAAGGASGWAVNDILDGPYDDVWKVTSVSGGVITGLALASANAPPYCTGSCPATYNLTGKRWTAGAGTVTVAVAWTAKKSLTVGGSTNSLGFYGATPIAKATPIGACAGNTGCQALRDALGNLGLINTGSITN